MEKNSVPKTIEFNRSYDGTHGTIHVFNIEFENGDTGEFTTTKKEQVKFKIGEATDYSIEQKKTKKGDPYTRIDKVSQRNSSGSYGARGGKSKEAEASILASVCLDCANIVVEKMKLNENVLPDLASLHALSDKFYKHITEKSSNDVQKRINYQSRLKEVVNHFMGYPKLGVIDSTKILEYVDKQVEYLQKKMS